ncbi:hypothetical protein CU669_07565 [Paramagnetospirillum kuznetsovii]|uniref:EAL domain-containing protein n=1 Tax=Paramagnetospirillum kuznetsovii TaxID=2053833 RepID=A0A364NZM4_9PROT|nr:hypothetical protein [Paramagnetospirillum kuznetsovii]RAU22539.1 hypothetical protein CU669_07565 [Paramagnetospirillum kuznetsovii]
MMPSTTNLNERARFEGLVDALVKSGDSGSFGKLHLVTIDHGNDEAVWQSRLPKILILAERILRSRLSNEDACLQLDPGQYMLLFPKLNEAEGMVKANAIAREIRERLFGKDDAALDVTVQLLPLSRLRSREAATSTETMEAVLSCHATESGIRLNAVFQPIWDAKEQMVIGNRLRIHRHFNKHDIFGTAALFGGANDPLAADANRILQGAALRAGHLQAPLFLPQLINDYSMTDEARITEEIGHITAGGNGKLVVELCGPVGSIGHPRLRNVISAIKAAKAQVAVQTMPDIETAKFLRDCGASFLCLNEAQMMLAGLTPSAILALFTVTTHEVQGLGYHLCLWNSTISQEVKRAASLGFRLFTGSVIGPNGTRPSPSSPKATSQIYS